MLEDCIKLLCYAFYGTKKSRISVSDSSQMSEISCFINALSGSADNSAVGSVNVKPLRRQPEGFLEGLDACPAEVARLIAGVCSQLNFFYKIDSVTPPLDKEELRLLTRATRNMLQLNTRNGDLLMSALTYNEMSKFVAVEPVEFSVGVLISMPLALVDSVFDPELLCYNELILSAVEYMKELNVPIEKKGDKYFISSILDSRFEKKKKPSGK